jgi:1-acyl-sn-glycerol-3-phosphate acyltransferase
MQNHSDVPSEKIDGATFDQERAREFTINWGEKILGRLFYWWSLSVAALLLLIFGPPVLIISLLARRHDWIYPWAHWGARNWLRLSGMRVIVRGREHLDPNQTYIFISNHRSYLDTATLFCYVGRPIGILAKKELTRVPILGQGMIYVGVVPIDRSNRARAIETLREATKKVRAGQSFGIFAEGTRAFPGQLLPFKKGPFYMAIEAGVPIVPVAMKNTDRLMGKGTGVARPGAIEMVFLPPVETRGLSTSEDVERLAHKVREMIAEELNRVSCDREKI